MASGNQVCSGNWPDFPITPINKHNAQTNSKPCETLELSATSLSCTIPKPPLPVACLIIKNAITTPIIKPISPVRVVKNAFRAADELECSSHQCPISINEHNPTSSQPISSINRLSA